MMQQSPASMAWMIKFAVVIVIVGTVLGLALSRTDLLNFNSSAVNRQAKEQAIASQAQKDAADLEVYKAQKQSELAAIEANTRSQQQTATVQAAKSVIDKQVYLVQQMAGAIKQVADAKQYEARQLAQAEADRQHQLTQIEVQREQHAGSNPHH